MTALSSRMRPEPQHQHDIVRCGTPVVTPADQIAVDHVMTSGWVGAGPIVESLETCLQQYVVHGEAVVFSSATAGLAATLRVRGVKPGSKVVIGALGFAAVVNAVRVLGAHPMFVDVTEDGSSLNPDQVEQCLNAGATAVVPLAWRGEPSDTFTLSDLCRSHHATLLEDGAYALGSLRDDRAAGTPECPIVVSFHPTKIVTAGLGGAVLGASAAEATRLRSIRNQGLTRSAWSRRDSAEEYGYSRTGFALEMSDIHAALGLSQLGRLNEIIQRRREIFDVYRCLIPETIASCPSSGKTPHGYTNASMFAVVLRPGVDRGAVRASLMTKGVGTAIHYPFLPGGIATRAHEAARQYPHALSISERTLTLPSHPTLPDSTVQYIADALTSAGRT